jgi:hypothetical protein
MSTTEMNTVRISRTVVAASVAAALGLTAACGGGGAEKAADKGNKPPRPAASRPAADGAKEKVPARDTQDARDVDRPLTEAQLKQAALETRDVKGYEVKGAGSADLQGQSVPAGPAECQPVADMFLFTTDPASRAAVSRGVHAEDDTDASVTTLALLSYESGEADEVLDGLRRATDDCTAYEYVGYKYTGVKALDDPDLGDESVAFRLVASIEGAKVPAAYTVVRDGTTLAAFSSMNMLDADKVEVPEEIVEAQLAKLKKAKATG